MFVSTELRSDWTDFNQIGKECRLYPGYIAEQRAETGLLINSYVPIPMSFHLGFTKLTSQFNDSAKAATSVFFLNRSNKQKKTTFPLILIYLRVFIFIWLLFIWFFI